MRKLASPWISLRHGEVRSLAVLMGSEEGSREEPEVSVGLIDLEVVFLVAGGRMRRRW